MKSVSFLPTGLLMEAYADVEPYYELLLNFEISTEPQLQQWLLNRSELESFISENLAWRYIRMTCHTDDNQLEKHYLTFVNDIQPHLSPLHDKLNRKMVSAEHLFSNEPALQLYLKRVKTELKLFREENIPLMAKLQTDAQKYASLNGAMSITYKDKEYTMQQAAVFLKSNNRDERKHVYELIQERRFRDSQVQDELFTGLVKTRHEVALNAGFENFRDYMFEALNRFDYNKEDCFRFHESVAKYIVPLARELHRERKRALMVDKLRPYDMDADIFGREPLKPFNTAEDLLAKTIICLNSIDLFFGECLSTMHAMGHLDLESRKGKAPGGYNYPLLKTGVPFIFMNASGLLRDVETLIHEAGHAVHSILTKDLTLAAYKEFPAEVAELASMSMELLSRQGWDHIFADKNEKQRAFKEQLEDIILTLPWIATIDRFQHKVYENTGISSLERETIWKETLEMFSTGIIDFTDYEHFLTKGWQKQLHLFEVPFYYIEYGFAQLGALAIWRNYSANGEKAIEQYKSALALGQTRTIPEVYREAGIHFDFSATYISELALFIEDRLQKGTT